MGTERCEGFSQQFFVGERAVDLGRVVEGHAEFKGTLLPTALESHAGKHIIDARLGIVSRTDTHHEAGVGIAFHVTMGLGDVVEGVTTVDHGAKLARVEKGQHLGRETTRHRDLLLNWSCPQRGADPGTTLGKEQPNVDRHAGPAHQPHLHDGSTRRDRAQVAVDLLASHHVEHRVESCRHRLHRVGQPIVR